MKVKISLVILTDALGNKTWDVRRYDCEGADSIVVHGIGKDEKFHQFDSENSIYVFEWAEKHGMKVEQETFEVEVKGL